MLHLVDTHCKTVASSCIAVISSSGPSHQRKGASLSHHLLLLEDTEGKTAVQALHSR